MTLGDDTTPDGAVTSFHNLARSNWTKLSSATAPSSLGPSFKKWTKTLADLDVTTNSIKGPIFAGTVDNGAAASLVTLLTETKKDLETFQTAFDKQEKIQKDLTAAVNSCESAETTLAGRLKALQTWKKANIE
jgi:hypothetical protein